MKRSSPALPLKSNPFLCISFTSKTKIFAKLSISLRVGSSNVFLNASSPPKLPPPILETASTSLVYWPNCKSTLLISFSLKVANSLSKSRSETITPLEKVLVKLTSTDPFGASSTFTFTNSDNSLKTWSRSSSNCIGCLDNILVVANCLLMLANCSDKIFTLVISEFMASSVSLTTRSS